jgi:hypothetical protein
MTQRQMVAAMSEKPDEEEEKMKAKVYKKSGKRLKKVEQ